MKTPLALAVLVLAFSSPVLAATKTIDQLPDGGYAIAGDVSMVSRGGVAKKVTQEAGIRGTTTNDNAAAGFVGEYVSSSVASGSAVAITTGSAANVTSISLTAGDWDVEGVVNFLPAGTTTQTDIVGGISQTSATLPTPPASGGYSRLQVSIPAGAENALPVGRTRISLAGTTTIYLVARSTFAVSTNAAYGFIAARRVR